MELYFIIIIIIIIIIIEPIPKLKIIAFNPIFQIINYDPDNRSNFEKLELIGKNGFWDSLFILFLI